LVLRENGWKKTHRKAESLPFSGQPMRERGKSTNFISPGPCRQQIQKKGASPGKSRAPRGKSIWGGLQDKRSPYQNVVEFCRYKPRKRPTSVIKAPERGIPEVQGTCDPHLYIPENPYTSSRHLKKKKTQKITRTTTTTGRAVSIRKGTFGVVDPTSKPSAKSESGAKWGSPFAT